MNPFDDIRRNETDVKKNNHGQAANARRHETPPDSEAKFKALFENAPLNSVIYRFIRNDQGVIVDLEFTNINSLGIASIGLQPEEIVGKTAVTMFGAEIMAPYIEIARQIAESGKPQRFETHFESNGHDYLSSNFLLGSELYANVSLDITDLKTTQHELSELNRTLEKRIEERTAQVLDLYNNAPVGYHSLDVEGRFLAVNQTELNWLGYSREELIGQPVTKVLSPESIQTFHETFPQFKSSGVLNDTEFEFIRRDGTTFYAVAMATAVYDAEGRYLSSRSTLIDITARKLAEKAQRESEERLELAFRAAQDGIWDWNIETGEVYYSSRYKSMLGYRDEEIEHHVSAWTRLMHPEDMPGALKVVEEVLGGKRDYVIEFRMLHKDGHYVDILSRGFPIRRKPDGRIARIVGTHVDLSDHKKIEETLKLANLELERAMHMKDEFLANMSHELRTPMNAILGLSEILLELGAGPLNDRQIRAMNTINKSGKHLLELINDILDLSKIEAEQMTLEIKPVLIADVCDSGLLFIREAAQKKKIRLLTEVDPEVIRIMADVRRIRQMIINLLSNAVKFTPDGGLVTLEVTGNKKEQTVSFSVTDTGIGIAPENIRRLFQPFVQLESGLTRPYEGTGLGLTLVDRMAKLHGGRVTVESELGKGSRFTIILPWNIPAPATADEPDKPDKPVEFIPHFHTDTHAPLILVVEDNAENIETMSAFLETMGCHYVVARNGKEALEQVPLQRPSLILMDLQMPVMDGLEAIRRLRNDADPRISGIPVIALTALAMTGDRDRALKAGANDYLSKPADLKHLAEMIKRLTSTEQV